MMKRMPPVEKIYEAFSAIADGRVTLGEGNTKVGSSDGNKQYTVTWDGDVYTSTDSATYWQGYAGYPVIAVLLLQGRLPLEKMLTEKFAGIDWHTLNEKHKRDYSAAAKVAMEQKKIPFDEAETAARKVLEALEALPLSLKRGSRPEK